MKYFRLYILILVLLPVVAMAQTSIVSGKVTDNNGVPIKHASVVLQGTLYSTETDENGAFEFKTVPYGNYKLLTLADGKTTQEKTIDVNQHYYTVDVSLSESIITLDAISVEGSNEETLGHKRLNAVENFGIYEGKKTEVIVLRDMTINAATNNPRQLYSKITGLNIWESDQAGLQLGIGGRGLSPNRTSNFNTRQNGYDISADALGYPESYYTPPAEALEQIEIIRGAASLQYGTQFGGLLNFKFKRGPANKKIELTTRQSGGSWGFFGTFNSIGGTVAKGKLNYYAYYQYKRGDGYRPNAGFGYNNAYASVTYQATEKLSVNVDITRMTYEAQQPGGLTDKLFLENPRQSVRARNWFNVNWTLLAVNATYKFNERTELNWRNFGLLAKRQSLGNLERINVTDFGGNRTLIDGEFKNAGTEMRLLHRYTLGKQQHALLTGIRIYNGHSTARQGDGSDGSGPDFYFLNPNDVENSDYKYRNRNYAAFLENIFDVTSKLSITPGIRFENIETFADGYYKSYVKDGAGNIVSQSRSDEHQSRKRGFLIGGLGVSYKHTEHTEFYSNVSQNYRAINFTDLHLSNPNFSVDPNIHDEKGFTADLGIRGTIKDFLRYEVTGFYLAYNDKIGQILISNQPPLYSDYRLRANISDARNIGIESFFEVVLSNLITMKEQTKWSVFLNTSVIDGRYVNSKDTSVKNKKVEMVPPFLMRCGTTYRYKKFSTTLQYAYVASHFTDATNAVRTATAVEGKIPSYQVVDLSLSYTFKKFTIEASANNLLGEHYFTRRAESYPGPGIIPADGRGFYVTLQFKY